MSKKELQAQAEKETALDSLRAERRELLTELADRGGLEKPASSRAHPEATTKGQLLEAHVGDIEQSLQDHGYAGPVVPYEGPRQAPIREIPGSGRPIEVPLTHEQVTNGVAALIREQGAIDVRIRKIQGRLRKLSSQESNAPDLDKDQLRKEYTRDELQRDLEALVHRRGEILRKLAPRVQNFDNRPEIAGREEYLTWAEEEDEREATERAARTPTEEDLARLRKARELSATQVTTSDTSLTPLKDKKYDEGNSDGNSMSEPTLAESTDETQAVEAGAPLAPDKQAVLTDALQAMVDEKREAKPESMPPTPEWSPAVSPPPIPSESKPPIDVGTPPPFDPADIPAEASPTDEPQAEDLTGVSDAMLKHRARVADVQARYAETQGDDTRTLERRNEVAKLHQELINRQLAAAPQPTAEPADAAGEADLDRVPAAVENPLMNLTDDDLADRIGSLEYVLANAIDENWPEVSKATLRDKLSELKEVQDLRNLPAPGEANTSASYAEQVQALSDEQINQRLEDTRVAWEDAIESGNTELAETLSDNLNVLHDELDRKDSLRADAIDLPADAIVDAVAEPPADTDADTNPADAPTDAEPEAPATPEAVPPNPEVVAMQDQLNQLWEANRGLQERLERLQEQAESRQEAETAQAEELQQLREQLAGARAERDALQARVDAGPGAPVPTETKAERKQREAAEKAADISQRTLDRVKGARGINSKFNAESIEALPPLEQARLLNAMVESGAKGYLGSRRVTGAEFKASRDAYEEAFRNEVASKIQEIFEDEGETELANAEMQLRIMQMVFNERSLREQARIDAESTKPGGRVRSWLKESKPLRMAIGAAVVGGGIALGVLASPVAGGIVGAYGLYKGTKAQAESSRDRLRPGRQNQAINSQRERYQEARAQRNNPIEAQLTPSFTDRLVEEAERGDVSRDILPLVEEMKSGGKIQQEVDILLSRAYELDSRDPVEGRGLQDRLDTANKEIVSTLLAQLVRQEIDDEAVLIKGTRREKWADTAKAAVPGVNLILAGARRRKVKRR